MVRGVSVGTVRRWHDGRVPDPLCVAYTLEQCWHDVPGGTAVAALEVLHRLEADRSLDVVGVAGRHRHPPPEPYRPAGVVRTLPIGRPWLYETWNRFGWPVIESVTGPVDVCHSTLAIPAATAAPHVVTVHDVAFVRAPERFSRHGVRVMRRGLDRCRDVDLVLCPSRATHDDLADLGFDPDRLRVVPWGVDARRVTDADLARVRTTHALPAEFVLFVGTLEPRKNLAGLVAAMRSVPELPLVVVGADGWGDAVPRDARSADVRFVGFVPDADLRPVMQAATVLAYPSLQEGFGLPVLEAMAQGTPVVTSRGSSTEEVAGSAAALADPSDAASIAAAIQQVLADRGRWSRLARERAGSFSWAATVEATIAAYREVAAA